MSSDPALSNDPVLSGDAALSGDPLASGNPVCPRCRAAAVVAVVRLPHVWTNASGHAFRVVSEVLLCTRCDAGDQAAAPVLACFAADGSLRPESAERLAPGLRRWAARARPPRPAAHAVDAEAEAWARGEL
ncbi:DUF6300 family protein [Nonomuraea antri]|uniref:DUF6300 family protein n=1 Tax=Nonomuraea antri TaxID=2730852 RepID=UPI00156822CF|nr:DUF6300 family protein [Nonomuraea antri]